MFYAYVMHQHAEGCRKLLFVNCTTDMAGILAFLAVIMTECQDMVLGLTCNIGLDFRTEEEFVANILKPRYALNKL